MEDVPLVAEPVAAQLGARQGRPGRLTGSAGRHKRAVADQFDVRPASRALFPEVNLVVAIGIACISLPYILMDRVQVRLYHGYVKGKPFWTLIKYALSSTDYRPCYAPWWYWRWYYWW